MTVEPLEPPVPEETRTLPNGGEVLLRGIRLSDRNKLAEAVDKVSSQTLYRRFLGPKKRFTDRELAYLTEVDFHTHVALVATLPADEPETIVGVGRYVLLDAEEGIRPRAEAALAVADCHQDRGIGHALLDRLASLAVQQGVRAFEGLVLSPNGAMRRLIEKHGSVVERRWTGNGERITIRLGV